MTNEYKTTIDTHMHFVLRYIVSLMHDFTSSAQSTKGNQLN